MSPIAIGLSVLIVMAFGVACAYAANVLHGKSTK